MSDGGGAGRETGGEEFLVFVDETFEETVLGGASV